MKKVYKRLAKKKNKIEKLTRELYALKESTANIRSLYYKQTIESWFDFEKIRNHVKALENAMDNDCRFCVNYDIIENPGSYCSEAREICEECKKSSKSKFEFNKMKFSKGIEFNEMRFYKGDE